MNNKKRKKKDSKFKKYTITSNHTFTTNISNILDELGKTSKNTFNHYLFCYKFYQLYQNIIYDDVFLSIIKDNLDNKDDIDILIHTKFKYYYNLYQSDYKNYISNNNIWYKYIKNLKININHTNFMDIYNNLIIKCYCLDKLILNNSNLIFLFKNNIFTIWVGILLLNTFYKKSYIINHAI